jgi:hypothetical protein
MPNWSVLIRDFVLKNKDLFKGEPGNPAPNQVSSVPPEGHWKVKNFYVDSKTGKLVVEYET